jgi:rhodanese-related sulfurtransferase
MQDITSFITNHPLLSAATFFVFILVMLIELIRAKGNVFNITPAKVTQLINRENAVIVDIRQAESFKKGHIIDAQNMQASDILKDSKKLDKLRTKPVIIVGNTGQDSQKIAAFLLKHGYNAYSLSGGMRAWSEAQMPLIGD